VADVHRHQERRAGRDPHQLAHRRTPLEVEAAQHAARRTRVVRLDEVGGQPVGGELVAAEDLLEEAAIVLEHLVLENNGVGNLGGVRVDLHADTARPAPVGEPLG
jgi:hypothetical protein